MHTLPDILCIGAAHWDVIGHALGDVARGADVPGRVLRRPGGVALNIAATLARFGAAPALLTAVGDDPEGDALLAACAAAGLLTDFAWRAAGRHTGSYVALEDGAGLVGAVADAETLEAAGEALLAPLGDGRLGSVAAPYPGTVVLDGNLTGALLASIAESPLFAAADLRVAAASPVKALRLRPLLAHPRATFHLNREEAAALTGTRAETAPEAAEALLDAGAARVLVTDGGAALALAAPGMMLTRTPPRVAVARVTGAGDTLMAAHIAAERVGTDPEIALDAALDAAAAFIAGETP